YRGDRGPLHISYPGVEHPITAAFMDAADQSGHPYNPDLNGELQEGVGYFQVSQRRGWRSSSATAFLAPALRRRNLTLVTHAMVRRIVIEGGRAVGVEYEHDGETRVARSTREVVLSGGTFASPKILMLSGVGPAAELAEHGIDIVADSPGVGRNLQEHPIGAVMFRVNVPTLTMELTPLKAMRHGIDFVLRGKGAISASAATAVVFAKFEQANPSPDVEMLFMPMAISRSAGGSKNGQDVTLIKEPIVLGSVWLCHPRSRGVISLRSADPAADPVITHQVIGEQSDVDGLVKGIAMIREIFAAEAMRPYVVGEVAPGAAVTSAAGLAEYLHGSTHRGEHGIGTCKMGQDPMAVVDPELRVIGVEGLRVVDASVMPTLMAGHSNAATVMIAERASDLLLGDAAQRP
ncbi:MAG TPA: GMC oxidoreductase, partial [Ilumatobacteraceae bacterium]